MNTKVFNFFCSILSFIFLSAAFTPHDNFLINCGSSTSSIAVDNRFFVGDFSKNGPRFLSGGKSFSVTNQKIHTPFSNFSLLHSTARVFTLDSSYVFKIKKNGTHFVRLHFSPFTSQNYDSKNAKFTVFANGLSLLSDFGVNLNFTVIKEFILMVDEVKLEILFKPGSNFAFVNAIEVFSAPKDYFVDAGGIQLISPNGVQEFNQNISGLVLETIHRINVGGSKITPFNDTLWRTWVPDEEFLVLKSAAKVATTFDPPNYQPGGATREIAPDRVYMTAQEMNIVKGTNNFMFNITWDFPAETGVARHFVRLHFCDIVSITLNTLYFNVYVNGIVAYKDLDLSLLVFHQLAVPYYADVVAMSRDDSDVLRISIGPSVMSNVLMKNAILNGVEIMKIVDSVTLPGRSKKTHKISIWILGVSVVALFVLMSLSILVMVALKKCRKRKLKPNPGHNESTAWTSLRLHGGSTHGSLSVGSPLPSPGANGYHGLQIPFADIQLATNNFDKDLIIGSGGFGTVYRGIFKDDTKVAVKRGIPGSRQGLPEFQTEINVLSKIRHRHLVSLIGYCEDQSEMILVYEYMEKGTLRSHLYGSELPPLSWMQRLQICIGAARGLHYLHTGSARVIIHRDIKSTNILLDENYVAKVADFGLSRSGPCLNETHISTALKGSFGYIDPEYFRRQQLTDKSDVYSFGVVLCEVLCARPAVDTSLAREEMNLAEWAVESLQKGMIDQIIDPRLGDQIKRSSLDKFGETALKCLAEYGADRPTMGDVLWNLERALRVQANEMHSETDEETYVASDVTTSLAEPSPVPGASSSTADGTSNTTTNKFFSQLKTDEETYVSSDVTTSLVEPSPVPGASLSSAGVDNDGNDGTSDTTISHAELQMQESAEVARS